MKYIGDTGSNYSYHRMTGEDSTAGATGAASDTFIKVSSIQSDAGLSGAANYGGLIVDILDYRNGSKNTTVVGTSGLTEAPIGKNRMTFFSGLWDNVAAVTSIVLAPSAGSNFIRGSEFTLYGIQE